MEKCDTVGLARLFEKRDYVFDILGGTQITEEERQLDLIEQMEQEQLAEEKKTQYSVDELDKRWKAKVNEIHKQVLIAAEALIEEHAIALVKAKMEDKLTLINLYINNYDLSVQQRLQKLAKYLEGELPKLLDFQEQAKNR